MMNDKANVIITPDDVTMNNKSKDNVEVEKIEVALKGLSDVMSKLTERLIDLEKIVSELPTPDKTLYKPNGYTDYLNIKGNYDEIYRRIEKLESMSHKAPTTDHGKRLTALEEKIDGMQSLE